MQVYQEKVENFLPSLPDEYVDLIIADPPFNLDKNYQEYKDNITEEKYISWVEEWIREGFRVLKNTGSFWIYCPSRRLGSFQTIGEKYGVWENTIVWFYSNPTPDSKRFPKTWSAWLFFSKTGKAKFFPEHEKTTSFQTKNRAGVYDVWFDIPKLTGGYLAQDEVILKPGTDKRECLYQLPIIMLQRIIGFCSEKGDTVLDLFSHSGTASKAAQLMERDWIAVEQGEYYCNIIRKRMRRGGFLL